MELEILKKCLIDNKVTIQINENPKFVQSVCTNDGEKTNPFDKIPSALNKSSRQDRTTCPCPLQTIVKQEQITTLYHIIIQLIDPKFEILSINDQDKEIAVFKEQMCKNLDNHMQFYRKLGFSRKKSITLDSLKNNIKIGDITPEILLYFANLLQKNIVLIKLPLLDREDYNNTVSTTESIILTCSNNIYKVYSETLKEMYLKTNTFKKDMKIAELRHLCKFFKLDGKTKLELQNALSAIFSDPL